MLLVRWVFLTLGVGAVSAGGIYMAMRVSRFFWRRKVAGEHKNGVLLQILLPKQAHISDTKIKDGVDNKTEARVAEQMFSELHSLAVGGWKRYFLYKQTISFEIVATGEAVRFYCFCPAKLVSFVQNAINAAYPEAEINPVPMYNIPPDSHFHTGIIRVTGHDYSPIRTFETLATDPLNSILNKISHLRPEETVIIQYLVTPVSGTWRRHAYSFLSYLRGHGDTSVSSSAEDKKTNNQTEDRNLYSEVERKTSRPGFRVAIRIVSASSDKVHARSSFENLARSYSIFDDPPLSVFNFAPLAINYNNPNSDFRLRMPPLVETRYFSHQFIANTAELATLFHFPGEDIESPRVEWLRSKRSPAPTDLPTAGTFLGYNVFRGNKTRIFVSDEDRRRHVYLIGQTGTGKSEFLKQMALQDIGAGHGVCFIDPHGDAAEDLLMKIPRSRIAETIYFDPGDIDFPSGLNIMEAASEDQKHILVNSFIALLYKLYDPNHTGIMGPMLERAIRNVMLTAMEEPGNTLIEVLRLLTSPQYASTKIPLIKDPLVKTYWTEELARTSDFHKSETLGYFVSKFDRFVTDSTLRNIIGQSKSAFDLREIMDRQRILIVNLAKGKLGEENSNFLGLLLIPKLLTAAMSRVDTAESMRHDFYLYVDEFQNFASTDFVEIMSEARKYRLSLTAANQYISQIQPEIRNAVFGNVGTIGAFRVGVDDAKYLIDQFAPVFNESDLTNNSIGQLYLKMLVNGRPAQPFSTSLDWSEISRTPKDIRVAELITKISQTKYATPRLIVEQEIVRRAKLYQ